jgi:hypothetical protein
MRCLGVCVLATALSSPLGASAQGEGSTPTLQQPQPERAQEASALQLKLDTDGVDVLAGSARTRDGYTLKEAHYGTPHRVQWDLAQSRLVF